MRLRSVSPVTGSPARPPSYVAQFESPDLVAGIIDGTARPEDDPRWARSGARDREEYAFWAGRSCGIACLRSILLDRVGGSPAPVALARELLAAGGYVVHEDGVRGLVYGPFVDYLRTRWAIAAHVRDGYPAPDLAADLRAGAWVIASVHSSIRDAPAPPPARGGHLVLAYAAPGAHVVFHDPAGPTAERRAAVRLPIEVFDHYYARRGIVVPPPSSPDAKIRGSGS